MGEVSRAVPKPLLPIGGMPILWHILKIYSQQGFNDFVLCLGHLGDRVERFFTEPGLDYTERNLGYRRSDLSERWEACWRIAFAHTGESTPTGGRVKQIEHLIEADDFMLTYGDGLADVSLADLLSLHQRQGRVATVTGARTNSQFGVLETADGVVTSFVEKPLLPQRINGGFFAFKRSVFNYLGPDDALEGAPLRRLVEKRQLAVYEHDGYWQCMDTRKDFEALNTLWARTEGQVPWKSW